MATAGADVDRVLRRLAEADFGVSEPPWSIDEDAALVRTLSTLQDVLTSVEKQSFEGTKVHDWMRKIKRMAYQIEDVLDESEEPTIIPSARSGCIGKAVFFCSSSPYVLRSNIAHRMKTIRTKLDRAVKDSLIFSLLQHTSSDLEQSNEQGDFDATAIVGRDNDKKDMEELLLQKDSETLSIIPIVGLEGLGKTTLARLIFDGTREGWNFDLHIWVHLNRNLDLGIIASEIISQANGTEERMSDGNTDSRIQESLQSIKNRLQEVLRDKSCLIILDDLRSTDKNQLAELKDMLKGTRKCTKVVVTTCSEITAELMHTKQSYNLRPLSKHDCWAIFSQRAFGKEGFNSCFTEIEMEIVERCEGIPAVAHFLGSIVHNQGMPYEEIWKLEKQIPQKMKIYPPFKQIYYNMSFALRSCFVYLSIVPKGSSIDMEKLIHEWTALGMLGSKHGALPPYAQGKMYIQELLSISFLQAAKTSVTGMNQVNDPLALNIHKLVHDFAIYIAGDDVIILSDGNVQSGRAGKSAFRYALLTNYNGKLALYKGFLSRLRALRLRKFEGINLLAEAFLVLKHLRVLDLTGCCIIELPCSIGQLKHLRCFYGSDLMIRTLPNQMKNLQNLEVLDLSRTSLEVLPSFIRDFQKLKYLNLQGCDKLRNCPETLGELSRLEYLNLSCCSILSELPESLCGLHKLRFLDLSSCTELQRLPHSFGELINLEDLNLSSCSKLKLLPKSFSSLYFLRFLRLSSYVARQEFQESLNNFVNLNILIPSDTGIEPSAHSQHCIDKQPCVTRDEADISNLIDKQLCVTRDEADIGTLEGDDSSHNVESYPELQTFLESPANIDNSEVVELTDPGVEHTMSKHGIGTDKQPCKIHDESEVHNLEVGDRSLQTIKNYSKLQQFQESDPNLDNLKVPDLPDPGIAPSVPKQNIGTDNQPYACRDEPEVSILKVGDRNVQTVECYSKIQQFQESLANFDNLPVLKRSDSRIALSAPKHSIGTNKQPCATHDKPGVGTLEVGDMSLQTVEIANIQQTPDLQSIEDTFQEGKIYVHTCQTMEHAMVSVATGVLSPLLGKLSTLLEEEYSKLQGVRDEIVFLQNELRSMHAFLVKQVDMDDLDIQVKEWRNQVRELSYDIEDCIDEFMLSVDHGSEAKKGLFQKSIHELKTLGARHAIAEIQKLKARVGDASERRTRYNFDGAISSSSGVVPIDPRLTALYDDVKCLMGIDGPKEEIIKLLTEGEGEQVQKLRVVSIWGFGGLGKTTLANQVYHQLKSQFDCHAFVSVSQKPDFIRLFSKILLEVKGHQSGPAYKVTDAIDELREHLLNKRYFVIIDDLWSLSDWCIVRRAFPENKRGSRVITTTRIESFARVFCEHHQEYIYKMRSLSEEDSRRLFFSRIFGSEDACPSHYKEASAEILKKCGGLPLAIITIASFLASQTTKQKVKWEYVRISLDTMIGANLNKEGMRQILNLSYINLPHCLKTCFLYLGIYPEDYSIRKYDLIGRWIAEGFVSAVQGRDAEDVAESYFNELANRSMIQIEQRNYKKVWSCRVHDMMYDLIQHKCRDENFITIIGDPRDMAGLHYKARRLSLQVGYSKHGAIPAAIKVSQIRSVATFGSSDDIHMLPLSKFKLIQVLILDFVITPCDMPIDLTGICELFHLRCFKIESELSSLKLQLPSQIRRLQYLETFEIRTGLANEPDIVIPSDIAYLPRLLHLIIPTCTNVLDRIGNMKSLHTLDCKGRKKISLEHIQSLAELTNLRYLDIHLDGEERFAYAMEYVDFLCSSLGKLADCNLKHLVLRYWTGNILWDGFNLSPSPRRFQTLVLWGCWFSKVPKWIADLHNLKTLSLTLVVLWKGDVNILAQLPALVDLRLIVKVPEVELVISGMGFPVLSRFKFVCSRIWMLFEAGGMPELQLLELWFRLPPRLVGTEHLIGLKEIKAVDRESRDKEYNRKTESALRSAIHMHPNHPIVNFTTGVWHAFL